MPIEVTCPCGKRLRVKDSLRGKQIRCPGCSDVLKVRAEPSPGVKRKPKPKRSKPHRKTRTQVSQQAVYSDTFEQPLPKKRKRNRRKNSRFSAATVIAIASVFAVISGVSFLGYKYLPGIIANVQNHAEDSLNRNDATESLAHTDSGEHSIEGTWTIDWEKTIAVTSDPARKLKLRQMSQLSEIELKFQADGEMEMRIRIEGTVEKLIASSWEHGTANQINGCNEFGTMVHVMTFDGPDQLRKITDGKNASPSIFVRSQ